MLNPCLTSKPFAHRGLFDNINVPENSISAFKKAINKEFGIELDIRITKDNKIVVAHDPNLMRMCGVNLEIEKHTFDEIKTHKLLNTANHIPLLSEVLALCESATTLIIEVKYSKYYKILLRELFVMLDSYQGCYCIESFDPRVITWLKKYRPDVLRGQLYSEFEGTPIILRSMLKNLMFSYKNNPHFIAADINFLPSKAIDKYRKKFPKTITIAWTIRTEAEMEKASAYADNIIFEEIVNAE